MTTTEETPMTSPLTDQQLDEIEARANAATPGPWKRSEDYSDVLGPDGSQLASYWMASDGEFIAHAREDVPALVAEVRRLRAELEDRADAEFVEQSAGTFTGTRPCGHDDYHDPHEWAERPDVWCPGIGYADDAPVSA